MYFLSWLSLLIPLAATSAAESQYLLTNPTESNDFKIPTSYESAVMGRRILSLTPLGTLSTVFPSDDHPRRRPASSSGMPVGLVDYIADCEDSGNPTILAINIATAFQNVASGSNISLSLQWTPPYPPSSRIESSPDRFAYSAANLPRFSLMGYLEKISDEEASATEVASCFTKAHPDAKYWLPGNKIHTSEWVRLVVTDIYWIGGFGDRAYIGWITADEWNNVTREEWEQIKLPGEKKGWKEWMVDMTKWDL